MTINFLNNKTIDVNFANIQEAFYSKLELLFSFQEFFLLFLVSVKMEFSKTHRHLLFKGKKAKAHGFLNFKNGDRKVFFILQQLVELFVQLEALNNFVRIE